MFGWTYAEILSLLGDFLDNANDISVNASFSVKAFNLKLIVLDKELLYKFIEYVPAFAHEFGRLLLSHLTRLVYFRLLKVGEDQNEDSPGIP